MIRVQLADATIKVGGDFQTQKNLIKGSGARWNPTARLWESKKSLQDWYIKPYDIEQGAESGDHVTRYGTHYTGAEWSGIQATNKAKAEISAQFQPQRDALKRELRDRLITIGISDESVNRLLPILQTCDLEFQVEGGRIQFSTPERAKQVNTIQDWYADAVGKLAMDELDAQSAAEERLSDAFGIY
jgi:hypothetical protein